MQAWSERRRFYSAGYTQLLRDLFVLILEFWNWSAQRNTNFGEKKRCWESVNYGTWNACNIEVGESYCLHPGWLKDCIDVTWYGYSLLALMITTIHTYKRHKCIVNPSFAENSDRAHLQSVKQDKSHTSSGFAGVLSSFWRRLPSSQWKAFYDLSDIWCILGLSLPVWYHGQTGTVF